MDDNTVYGKCIAALYEKTDAKFEHDEEKAIELFDKLLDEGLQSHCDIIKKLCLGVGYGEPAAQEIADIYDIISLYKAYKKKDFMWWDLSQFLEI